MKGREDFKSRMDRLVEQLRAVGMNGVLMAPGPNVRYYTGVNSLMLERPFLLFVSATGEVHLVAPKLEAGPYRDCPLEIMIHEWSDSEGPAAAFRRAVRAIGLGGIWGVEGRVPFLYLEQVRGIAEARFESAEGILQNIREVKDESEATHLRRSAKILSRAFEDVTDVLKDGVTEIEIARRLADLIHEHGGQSTGDILVQAGERAAFPHGLPTPRKVRRKEAIIIDVSSTYNDYYADITRTYCIGSSNELEKVYSEVLEAQKRAINSVREGVTVGEVDGGARGHLRAAGLGEYFIHRTGHGLGLEVHEAPYLVEGGKEKLKSGAFFTVEPGVYIPGKLGVRIEDDVTVRGKNAVVITDTPKEFGWWK